MRRSSSADRKSLCPLRVRNDDNNEASSSKSRKRSSSTSRKSIQSNMRSLSGNRVSVGGGRLSVGGGRLSVGGMHKSTSHFSRPAQQRLSRGSGMGVRNNGVPKDPRPISDKAFQHRCIKNVFGFLTDKGYPDNITMKMLQSPTNKDFVRIFVFMYGLVAPDHRPLSRPEEDIPKILKTLGYPFMISKSSLFAVGSPHMWPSILAALNWLVELIEYGVGMAGQIDSILFPADEDSFDNTSETQGNEEHVHCMVLLDIRDSGYKEDIAEVLFPITGVVHYYMVQTYKEFLNGKDDFTEEVDALRSSFKKKLGGSSGGIDDLVEENRILKMQLEHLESDKDKLKSEQQTLQLVKLDEERMITFLNELETHKGQIDKQSKEKEEECLELESEIEEANGKFLKMQLIYERQEFSQEDVERLKQKGRELQLKRVDVEKKIQSMDKEIWQKEMTLSKSMEQIDEKCQAYNKVALSLKIIPITAENSSGIDFELQKLTFSNDEVSHFDKVIKPALNMMKRQCQDSCMSMEAKKMTLVELMEEVGEVLSDINNEITLLTSKNKRVDMELENKKQVNQTEREAIQHAIEELENDKLMWTSGTLYSKEQIENEKKKLQKRAEAEKEKMLKKLRDYRSFFEAALTIFIEHMSSVQMTMAEAKEIIRNLYEETQEKARQMGIEEMEKE